jgi:hypothetical protein
MNKPGELKRPVEQGKPGEQHGKPREQHGKPSERQGEREQQGRGHQEKK